MFLVITMNVAIFVNVAILVDVVILVGHVICENVVDLVILIREAFTKKKQNFMKKFHKTVTPPFL